MFVKQYPHGEWYVCKRTSSNTRGKTGSLPRNRQATFRNWFLIKSADSTKSFVGKLFIRTITLPQEFVGKKVRLKIEIVDY